MSHWQYQPTMKAFQQSRPHQGPTKSKVIPQEPAEKGKSQFSYQMHHRRSLILRQGSRANMTPKQSSTLQLGVKCRQVQLILEAGASEQV